jgi:hypothetical protein
MTNSPETQEVKKATVQSKKGKITHGELARNLANLRAKDMEEVNGIFRNLEHTKGSISFRWNGTYGGAPYDHYVLEDGQRYKLPRGLVKHLNNNVHYYEYSDIKGDPTGQIKYTAKQVNGMAIANGKVTQQDMTIKKKVPRCEFIVLDFLGEEANDILPSHLVEVTTR